MPTSRPSRPPPPERASPELIRFVMENRPVIQWKDAVHREACAMVMTGPGPWHIKQEHYVLARQALRERGVTPPPGYIDPGY